MILMIKMVMIMRITVMTRMLIAIMMMMMMMMMTMMMTRKRREPLHQSLALVSASLVCNPRERREGRFD